MQNTIPTRDLIRSSKLQLAVQTKTQRVKYSATLPLLSNRGRFSVLFLRNSRIQLSSPDLVVEFIRTGPVRVFGVEPTVCFLRGFARVVDFAAQLLSHPILHLHGCRSLIRLGGLFLALRSNQKGAVDVTNSPASVDKVALFLRCWVVNDFGCRMDYHNEAVG